MLLLCIALMFYISMYWGAIFFFKTTTKDAIKGKRLIGVVSSLSTLYTIYTLYHLNFKSGFEILQGYSYYISCILYSVALLIFWLSYLTVKNFSFDFAFSSKNPENLVQHGIYKFIRHPFYSSYILGWLAPLIYIQNLISLTIFIVMTLIYIISARKEEKILLENYQNYIGYKKTTGMFFPFL